MRVIVAVTLLVAVIAFPAMGIAKECKPVCKPVVCAPACPAPCVPCIPSPCKIVGSVLKGVGCVIGSVGEAVSCICPCCPKPCPPPCPPPCKPVCKPVCK